MKNGRLRKIVAYEEGKAAQCEAAIEKVGGTVCKKLPIANALVCTLPDDHSILSRLNSLPCVKQIDDDFPIKAVQKKP